MQVLHYFENWKCHLYLHVGGCESWAFLFFFLFFSFLLWPPSSIWSFLGQGSDPSHGYNPRQGILSPLCWTGLEPESPCSETPLILSTTNPVLLKALVLFFSPLAFQPHMSSDTIEVPTAPAKGTSDLHVNKCDGRVSFLAVTLSSPSHL